MTINDDLYDAIVFGDRKRVVELVQQAVDTGEDVSELLNETMIPALREVGDQFSRGEVFVPEMLVSAKAMQAGVDIIEPLLVESGHEPIAKICIGSVKGDLHDIGKNLVVMMLKGSGFDVDDLGVDCRIETFAAAVEKGAKVLCLSALLSTTRDEMRPVIDHFKDRDDIKIVVGGAVITQEFADAIGADGFGFDASDAVRAVRESLGLDAVPV
ncbi:MAG: corrinoid protein [Gammaproteobacteria bacterium]|nr:corrinoid protein [Gammaproteobacteria bacterium]MDH3751204.1 corrinoid protein [Gammaproteobacteria bacterium]MDH3804517.1 corrinoid protein [Gammaproteobacteria bacterium]